MSRRCDLTGKGPQTGHKVSHSNRKTKRRFLPNLCNVTLISDALDRSVKLRISANALKSVDHRGGLDGFLAKAGSDKSKLLSANIWLTDMGTFNEMNAVWDAWVSPGNTPARATVEARLANPKYLVEIMVTAAV